MPKVLSQLVNTTKPLLSKPDLQKFNLCQIYLQGRTLSDIATSSGKQIDCHFWKGHRSSHKSSFTWPHQIRPSTACWALWRKTLHLLFTDSVRSNKILPQYCLHSWYPKAPFHQFWPTFIDPPTSLLYTRLAQHNSFRIYSHQNRFSYYPTTTHSALPTGCVPITVTHWLPFVVTTKYATRSTTLQPRVRHPQSMLNNVQPLVDAFKETNQTQNINTGAHAQIDTKRPLSISTPHTSVPLHSQLPSNTQHANFQRVFQHHLTKVSPSNSFFLGHMVFSSKLQKLVDNIHNSCFAMASNGSVRTPNGSFSWVIYGT